MQLAVPPNRSLLRASSEIPSLACMSVETRMYPNCRADGVHRDPRFRFPSALSLPLVALSAAMANLSRCRRCVPTAERLNRDSRTPRRRGAGKALAVVGDGGDGF